MNEQIEPAAVLIVNPDGNGFAWHLNPNNPAPPFVLAAASLKLQQMVLQMINPPAVQPSSAADAALMAAMKRRNGLSG